MRICIAILSISVLACSDDRASNTAVRPREPAADTLVGARRDSESQRLYDENAFETFDLIIDPEKLAELDADPTAERYVAGALSFDGKTHAADIRYKGSVGAWHRGGQRCVGKGSFTTMPTGAKTCQKLGVKVSFNERDPEGRFLGLKKVLFHAMNQDTSLLRERLGYEIFRGMGVAAPRASHARLLINGEFQGVYAFVEYVDGRFTHSRWSGGEGNIYKEVWPAIDDKFVQNTPDRMLDALRTNENEEAKNLSFEGFLELEKAMVDAKDDDAQLAAMSEWIDLDYLLRYIAADRATAHDDGILHFYPQSADGGEPWSNHNYYWYESATHDRLWLIPWDLDNAWNINSPVTRINADWNDKEAGCKPSIVEGFGIAQIPPSCSPVIRAAAHESLAADFEGYVTELLDGALSEPVIEAKVSRWSALIASSVEEASHFEGELSVAGWETGKAELRSALEVTRNKLRVMVGRPVAEAESVALSGYVTAPERGEPFEGVSVCVYGRTDIPCVKTNATGAYTLAGVPVNSEQILTFNRMDLVPVARNYAVATTDFGEPIADATNTWARAAAFLAPPAAGKTTLQFFPYGMSRGRVLTLQPDPGVAPRYYADNADGDLVWDQSASASSDGGLSVVVDIEPGEYHAMFEGCMGFRSQHWGLPAANGSAAVRVRAVAGYVMHSVVQICN